MTIQATEESERKRFFSLLDKFQVAMLVSHGVDGALHARPMAIAGRDDGGNLLFLTRSEAPKVQEFQKDERVLATLQQSGRYMSISGTARLERDPHHIRKLWKERWRAWFPEGPRTADLTIVRLSASEGDYWDYTGLRAVKHAFRTARAVLRREKTPSVKEGHHHISLPS